MSLLMVLLIFIVLLLAIIWCCLFSVPSLRQIWMVRKLPGPRFMPIIGPVHEFPFLKTSELLDWLYKTAIHNFDRISTIWVVGTPNVYVNNVEDIEVILSSTKYINKGKEYIPLEPWLQEGLLTSTGTKWHTRRKLLTPTFHFKILDDKSKTMYVHSRKFVNRLLEANGHPFDASKKISNCTLDIIGETAMGVSLNSQDDQSSDYVATIRRVTNMMIYRVLNVHLFQPWVWALTATGAKNAEDVNSLHQYTSKIIAQRRAVFSQTKDENVKIDDNVGEKKRQAFLDTLLELDATNEGRFTDADIREEVDTFLFEGHDTTAALILFALFELGHNPDVQELAYREQYEIFGVDERSATMDDYQNMHYLERVIKECLRLYPSVPYVSRFVKEDIHLNGLPPIPADTNIVILPFFLHRNPKHFSDPLIFNPDRFLPEECKKRHPFSYIPFSAGPRNCVGQRFAMLELKALLSTVIRFTKVESVTKRSELKLAPVVLLRPVDPILIRVLPRN